MFIIHQWYVKTPLNDVNSCTYYSTKILKWNRNIFGKLNFKKAFLLHSENDKQLNILIQQWFWLTTFSWFILYTFQIDKLSFLLQVISTKEYCW
jgi:hypothetical protein